MAELPFIKFYPSDWLGSTKLRGVSLAARGVWIDLLAIMWECTPRGTLTVAGRPLSVTEAAKRVHGPIKAVERAIEELLDEGVADMMDNGTIFSARMMKDAAIHEVRSEAGARGGKASLGSAKQTSSKRLNLLEQNAKQNNSKTSNFAQPSEGRSQKPETRAAAEGTEPAAAAAGNRREGEAAEALTAVLVSHGIGEPVLSELSASGIEPSFANAVCLKAKRAGKGPGVIVNELRTAAAAQKANAAASSATRATREAFGSVWGVMSHEARERARNAYRDMKPHMRQYTGGAIEDLGAFQAWVCEQASAEVAA